MGQSVHATGFRLRKFKNWETKECIIEKEIYVKNNDWNQRLLDYVTDYFVNIVDRRFKEVFYKVSLRYKKKLKTRVYNKRIRKIRKLLRIAKIKKKIKLPRARTWLDGCRYKTPAFFYSHSIVFKTNKSTEINVVLYGNISLKGLFRNRVRLPNDIQNFSKRFPVREENIEKYANHLIKISKKNKDYLDDLELERLVKEQTMKRFGVRDSISKKDMNLKERKKNLSKMEKLRRMFSKSGYYRSFVEKKWKEVFKSIVEARLAHNYFKSDEKFNVKIHFLKSPWLKSSLCARYLVFLLKKRKGYFRRVAGNLLSRTEFYGGEKHNLYGIFISGAGRFTKKQRASYIKTQKGRVPFSTPTAPVEYMDLSVPLKYGACSVRVWICHLRDK